MKDHKTKVKGGSENAGFYHNASREVALLITRVLVRTPITPNQVTVFNIALTFTLWYFFFYQTILNVIVGIFILYFSMVLDRVDGQLARARNMQSKRGQFLDGIYSYFLDTNTFVPLGAGLFLKTGEVMFLIIGFTITMFYMYTSISSRERGLLIGGQLGGKLVLSSVKVDNGIKTMAALPNRHLKEILLLAVIINRLDTFLMIYAIYAILFWFGYISILSIFPEDKKT